MTGARALAVGALVAVLALSGAGPAWAAPPSGGITSPAADAELTDQGDVVISVSFSAPSGGEITNAALSLHSVRGDSSDDRSFPDINQGSFSHTWSTFEPGMLDYNGEYRIRAEATATDGAIDANGPETTVRTRSFYLAVPPVAPADVEATFNDSKRTVAVSWTGNPEPDLLGYIVQRKPEGGSFSSLAEIEPGTTTYTDEVEELEGDYAYRVVALREGAQDIEANPAEAYEALNSDPSAEASATVAAPPTTTSPTSSTEQTSSPTSEQGGGTTTPTSEQESFDREGRVDLSGFAALLDQARSRPQPRPTTTDPGFTEELPYGSRPPGSSAAPTTAGEPDVEIALADDDGELGEGERLRSMAFLAGGLFSFVLLMHLVWIRTEVKHAPLEVDEPGGDSSPRAEDASGLEDASGDDASGDASGEDASGDDGPTALDGGPATGTLGAIPGQSTPRKPRKRSQGARGAANGVSPRSRGDRREGRPAVRARR